jgi:molybdate transport system substrate-binding protein
MIRRLFAFAATAAATTFIAALSNGGLAHAAEVKVLSSPAVRGVVSELGRQFEGATGHKLVVDFDVFAVLKRRIDAGETFDIAVLSPALIDDLIKLGKVAADTRADLGRHGTGLGVRKGAPKPDIGSVEAFKRTMLNAKSVAYFKEGTAGLHFLSVLDRLGIATDMKPKLKAYEAAGIVQAVESGEVELVVAGIGTIVALPSVELVGGLPPELQSFTAYTAGVSATAKQPEAARTLIRFLTAPAATQVIKANGFEPSK